MAFEKPIEELEKEGWIKARCLTTEQPGGTLYTISISGKELVKRSRVLARALKKNGVQRVLSPIRCRRIAKFYTQENAMLVNNIIGNLPIGMVEFRDGQVYIHPSVISEIIDGQHRLWGFADEFNEEDVDFEILYTFIINADAQQRAALFYKINKEQKKINPSLAFDLLEIIDDGSEEQKISMLVKKLNEDSNSPFYEIIGITEKERGRISLAAMTNKIKKFLKTPMGNKFYKNGQLEEEAIYITLRNYFNVIRTILPDEWDDPDSVLVKTLGFGAFVELLSDVLTEFARNHGYMIPTEEQMLEILEPLGDFDIYEENIGSFGGEKGQRQLAFLFKDALGFGTFST